MVNMMAMTDGERRAYQRGYNRARSWPDHRPPQPPNEIIAELMKAATELRDRVDGIFATFEEDDPIQAQVNDAIEPLDRAMKAVTKWLLENENE